MKKYLFFISITLLAISCSKSEDASLKKKRVTDNSSFSNASTLNSNSVSFKKVSDYNEYGLIHNLYLEQVCNSYNDKSSSMEGTMDYTRDFLSSFQASESELYPELSEKIYSLLEDETYIYTPSLRESSQSIEISEVLLLAKNNNIIDVVEYDILIEILEYSNEYPTFEEIDIKVNELIEIWNNQEYEIGTNRGNVTGIVLSITKLSTEWWMVNNDCLESSEERIPWLAADAIGAAIGVGLHMLTHAASNEGSLEGCCGDGIGVSIVAGAVLGSTGIVGKLGKALSKWWP